VAVLAAVAALAIPSTAAAWSWGYNYMGSSVNTTVVAGWNYWSYSYADKRSGDRIYHEWKVENGSYCDDLIDGVTTYYSTPSNCGFGGYLYVKWGWVYGNSSYVYLEAN
jgi:hypothetical protein